MNKTPEQQVQHHFYTLSQERRVEIINFMESDKAYKEGWLACYAEIMLEKNIELCSSEMALDHVSKMFKIGEEKIKDLESQLTKNLDEHEKSRDCWLICMDSRDSQIKEFEENIKSLQSQLAQKEDKGKEAEEALKMYANIESWIQTEFEIGTRIDSIDWSMESDEEGNFHGEYGGKRAREWVKKWGMK